MSLFACLFRERPKWMRSSDSKPGYLFTLENNVFASSLVGVLFRLKSKVRSISAQHRRCRKLSCCRSQPEFDLSKAIV